MNDTTKQCLIWGTVVVMCVMSVAWCGNNDWSRDNDRKMTFEKLSMQLKTDCLNHGGSILPDGNGNTQCLVGMKPVQEQK